MTGIPFRICLTASAAALWCAAAFAADPKDPARPLEREAKAPAALLEREAKAPQHIRTQLTALRNEVKAKRLTFEVGYTKAMDHQLAALCGTRPPANLAQLAAQQNAAAVQLKQVDEAARAEFLKGKAEALPDEQFRAMARRGLPQSFDWTEHHKVSRVKDQGGCGSCWDFATIGAFEGSYMIRNTHRPGLPRDHRQPDASEQCVLDCSKAGSCKGGWWAFDFLVNHGTASESVYPYTGHDGACKGGATPYRAVAWGYVHSGGGMPSTAEIKQALLHHGPLCAAVRATPLFQAYVSGVFDEHDAGAINHGITIVGWDDRKGPHGAWKIKNSWSELWGEQGFMWIAYGSNSIGYAAAWVDAKYEPIGLPQGIHKVRPNIKPDILPAGPPPPAPQPVPPGPRGPKIPILPPAPQPR